MVYMETPKVSPITLKTLLISDPEYDEACEELQSEYGKDRPSSKVVRRMMRKTFQRRRQWIITDSPTIVATCDTFPPLASTKYVSLVHCVHYMDS